MGWCKVALLTAFAVLLQCELQHAASCENRRTVIQIKIPGKTNINIKFPPKSDPVKFVPYPKEGKNNGDCFICIGPRCRKCTTTENQIPVPIFTQGKEPQRTNIIIDLRQKTSDTQNEPNNQSTNINPSTGGVSPQDGTVVVVQDSTSASSASNSATSDSSQIGGQTAASSATSATTSNTDIIASFDQNNSGVKSTDDTENIFVEDESQSIAGSSAVSNIKINSDASSIGASNGNVTSNAGAKSAVVTNNNGTSDDDEGITKVIVKSSIENGDGDGDGAGSASVVSKVAAEDSDDLEGII